MLMSKRTHFLSGPSPKFLPKRMKAMSKQKNSQEQTSWCQREDDMQHFYENGEPFDADEDGTNIAANNNDEDGTIGYNWLSG